VKTPGNSQDYFPLVQALRGFAALCVVVTHALLEAGVTGSRSALSGSPTMGEVGVDIFFVISGFIMVVVSKDAFGQKGAFWSFLKKRIARVVPLYWLLSLLLIAIILLAPALVENPDVDFVYWLKSLLFVPVEHPGGDGIRPVLVVGWTLQFEMFFYGLFAIMLLLPRRRALPLLLILLVGIMVLGMIFEPESNVLRFFSNPLLLEFAAGVVIGWMFVSGVRLPASMTLISIVLSLGLIVAGWQASHFVDMSRVVYFGIPAAILVAGLTLADGVQTRNISLYWMKLGSSSYALYLSHVFVIAALGTMMGWYPLWRDLWYIAGMFIVISVAISCFTGWWLHDLVERRINKGAAKLLEKAFPTSHHPAPKVGAVSSVLKMN